MKKLYPLIFCVLVLSLVLGNLDFGGFAQAANPTSKPLTKIRRRKGWRSLVCTFRGISLLYQQEF